jgi:hypothetical protein
MSTQRRPLHTAYRTADVDGFEMFYREAGDRSNPTLLLLHGFPTPSHMFRDLIPLLADRFHLVAPDLPGLLLLFSVVEPQMPAHSRAWAHRD